MSHEPDTEGGGDDLFSLLLTLLENIWLLLGLSLGAGLIALALSHLTQARYISNATIDPAAGLPLDVDHQAFLALRTERQKLLPILLTSTDTLSVSRMRMRLGADVGSAQVNTGANGTLSLRVGAPTPQIARELADTVIAVALEKTRPSTDVLVRLETEFKSMKDQAKTLRKAGEALRSRLATADANGDVSGQLASNLGAVIGETSNLGKVCTTSTPLV